MQCLSWKEQPQQQQNNQRYLSEYYSQPFMNKNNYLLLYYNTTRQILWEKDIRNVNCKRGFEYHYTKISPCHQLRHFICQYVDARLYAMFWTFWVPGLIEVWNTWWPPKGQGISWNRYGDISGDKQKLQKIARKKNDFLEIYVMRVCYYFDSLTFYLN